MIEITNEFRARVFAAYMPCLAMYGTEGPYAIQGVSLMEEMAIFEWDEDSDWWNITDKTQLILTDLQNITDEDAIEVAKIAGWDYNNSPNSEAHFDLAGLSRFLKEDIFNERTFIYSHLNAFVVIKLVDYLRSKHYLLPFLGIDLIAAGIAIIKTHK